MDKLATDSKQPGDSKMTIINLKVYKLDVAENSISVLKYKEEDTDFTA